MQKGQAVATVSTPLAMISSTRLWLTRVPVFSSIHMRPPPAPQQKPFSRLRGSSTRALPVGKRGRANGMVVAAIGLGSAIAPPLVSFLMVRWGWRAALMASSVPALVVGCAWMWIGRRALAPAEAARAALGGVARIGQFIIIGEQTGSACA